MVTYDGENQNRLRNCLQSISEQTMLADEMILVLDGRLRSELRDIIDQFSKKLKIQIVQSKKQGLAKCLNEGIKHITYDIVVRCDSDDINLNTRFQKQVEWIEESGADLVSNGIQEFDDIGIQQKSRLLKEGPISKNNFFPIFRNPVNHNCCCFKKTSVINSGCYPDGRMEDYRLWLQMINNNMVLKHSNEILLKAYAGSISNRRIGRDYLAAEIDLFLLKLKIYPIIKIPIILATLVLRCFVRLPLINNVLPKLYRYFLRK